MKKFNENYEEKDIIETSSSEEMHQRVEPKLSSSNIWSWALTGLASTISVVSFYLYRELKDTSNDWKVKYEQLDAHYEQMEYKHQRRMDSLTTKLHNCDGEALERMQQTLRVIQALKSEVIIKSESLDNDIQQKIETIKKVDKATKKLNTK